MIEKFHDILSKEATHKTISQQMQPLVTVAWRPRLRATPAMLGVTKQQVLGNNGLRLWRANSRKEQGVHQSVSVPLGNQIIFPLYSTLAPATTFTQAAAVAVFWNLPGEQQIINFYNLCQVIQFPGARENKMSPKFSLPKRICLTMGFKANWNEGSKHGLQDHRAETDELLLRG